MAQNGEENEQEHSATLINYLAALGKRRVFGTAAIYVPSAWLLVEIASFVLDLVNGPDWMLRITIAFAAGGLPVALYLAWVYDVTRDGIVRTKGVFHTTPAVVALSILVLAGSTLGFWKLLEPRPAGTRVGPCESIVDGSDSYLASVAVLPFRYLSSTPAEANITDGFSEEIRSLLSKLESFCVPARISRDSVQSNRSDIRAVGDYLNVEYILDGTVQVEDEQIRVTAELVNTSSALLEWSDTYTGNRDSLFDVQDSIARGIVGSTQPAVIDDIARVLGEREVTAADSHYLFLLGRYYFYQYSLDGMQTAIELYDRALAIDDTNPILHSEYFRAHALVLSMTDPEHWGDQANKAKAALQRALALNHNLAPVQTALAISSEDIPVKIEALLRALELNPTYADAWRNLSMEAENITFARCLLENNLPAANDLPPGAADYLASLPEMMFDPLRMMETAYRLDPYNAPTIATLAGGYENRHRHSDARELYERTLLHLPNAPVIYTHYGRHLSDQGRLVEGTQRLQKALELDYNGWRMLFLILNYLALEDHDAAGAWLDAQRESQASAFISGHFRFFQSLQTRDFGGYLDSVNPDVNPIEHARMLLYAGRHTEGIAILRPKFDARQLGDYDYLWVGNELAVSYLTIGKDGEATKILEDVDRFMRAETQCSSYDEIMLEWAISLALLERWDEALNIIEHADEHTPGAFLMTQHQAGFDQLKKDERIWLIVQNRLDVLNKEKDRWQRIRASEFLQPRAAMD